MNCSVMPSWARTWKVTPGMANLSRRFEVAFRAAVNRAIERGELRCDVDVRRSIASIVGSFLFARFMSSDGFDRSYADAVLDDFVRVNAPH